MSPENIKALEGRLKKAVSRSIGLAALMLYAGVMLIAAVVLALSALMFLTSGIACMFRTRGY